MRGEHATAAATAAVAALGNSSEDYECSDSDEELVQLQQADALASVLVAP